MIPLPKNLNQPLLQIIPIAVSLSANGKLGQQANHLPGPFVSSTSKRSAERKGDENLLRIIRGVDLIAAGARYHTGCRSQYVNSRSANQSESHREDVYTQAFDVLAQEIELEFDSG